MQTRCRPNRTDRDPNGTYWNDRDQFESARMRAMVRSSHLGLNWPFSGRKGIVAQVKGAGATGRAQARS